jgi:hypothetical protein
MTMHQIFGIAFVAASGVFGFFLPDVLAIVPLVAEGPLGAIPPDMGSVTLAAIATLIGITPTAVGVWLLTAVAQMLFPEQLAPKPSTLTSRRKTITFALVCGAVLGALKLVMPFIVSSWPAYVVAGILSACVAVVFRNQIGRKLRKAAGDEQKTTDREKVAETTPESSDA